MAPNNRSLSLAALILALAFVPRAEATLMKAATFDEKVENAASIIVGTAVRKESRWDADHRWILTYTTFRIDKTIKGIAVENEITIVTPGGQVGKVRQDTIGVPDFAEGSQHVLFTRNTNVGPTVLYFDQGAYEIVKNEKGDAIVKPAATEAVTIDTQRGMAVAPEAPRTLQQFERDVRESERRALVNRMELVRQREAQAEPSLWQLVARNKYLILLAIAGIAFATWHFLRR